MNEKEVLEWLNLGLDISDDLSNLRMDGKTLVQKTIAELTRGPQRVSTESALKIYKEIAKASERDMEDFDLFNPFIKITREDEHSPFINSLSESPIITKSVRESVELMFGSDLLVEPVRERIGISKTKSEYECDLNEDEALAMFYFAMAMTNPKIFSKVFKPFLSYAPADLIKSKDYLVRLFSAIQKLPMLEDDDICLIPIDLSGGFFKEEELYLLKNLLFIPVDYLNATSSGGNALALCGKSVKGHKFKIGGMGKT